MSIKLRIGKNQQDFLTDDRSPINRYDSLVDVNSIAMSASLESKGTTLNFDLVFSSDYMFNYPQEGNEVHLYINNIRVFGGTLLTISRSLGLGGFNELIYRCSCVDFTYLLDRKFVNNIYDEATPPEMIYAILEHLNNASVDIHYGAMLAGSGFIQTDINNPTIGYSTLGLNPDNESVDILIPNIKQQRFDRIRPSVAFTTACKAANMHWWIDEYKRINVKFTDDNPSPLTLRHQGILDIATQIDTFFDWEEEGDVAGIGNKSILKDATIKEVTARINTAIHQPTDKKTGEWYTYTTDAKPFDHLSINSVIIYANQAAYDAGNSGTALEVRIDGFTVFDIPESLATAEVGIRIGADAATIFIHESQLSTNNLIEINYRSSYQDDYEGLDSALIDKISERTGGDGIHEFVISNISALNVESTDALDEINTTLLRAKARVPQYRGKFNTYQVIREEDNRINGQRLINGNLSNLLWRPGQSFERQLLTSILPKLRMYIIKVDTIVLRAGGSFKYTKPATNLNPAEDVYYETILQHTITYSSVPTGLLV